MNSFFAASRSNKEPSAFRVGNSLRQTNMSLDGQGDPPVNTSGAAADSLSSRGTGTPLDAAHPQPQWPPSNTTQKLVPSMPTSTMKPPQNPKSISSLVESMVCSSIPSRPVEPAKQTKRLNVTPKKSKEAIKSRNKESSKQPTAPRTSEEPIQPEQSDQVSASSGGPEDLDDLLQKFSSKSPATISEKGIGQALTSSQSSACATLYSPANRLNSESDLEPGPRSRESHRLHPIAKTATSSSIMNKPDNSPAKSQVARDSVATIRRGPASQASTGSWLKKRQQESSPDQINLKTTLNSGIRGPLQNNTPVVNPSGLTGDSEAKKRRLEGPISFSSPRISIEARNQPVSDASVKSIFPQFSPPSTTSSLYPGPSTTKSRKSTGPLATDVARKSGTDGLKRFQYSGNTFSNLSSVDFHQTIETNPYLPSLRVDADRPLYKSGFDARKAINKKNNKAYKPSVDYDKEIKELKAAIVDFRKKYEAARKVMHLNEIKADDSMWDRLEHLTQYPPSLDGAQWPVKLEDDDNQRPPPSLLSSSPVQASPTPNHRASASYTASPSPAPAGRSIVKKYISDIQKWDRAMQHQNVIKKRIVYKDGIDELGKRLVSMRAEKKADTEYTQAQRQAKIDALASGGSHQDFDDDDGADLDDLKFDSDDDMFSM